MDMSSIQSESYPDDVNIVGIKKEDQAKALDPPHEPNKRTEHERNDCNCLLEKIPFFPTFIQ